MACNWITNSQGDIVGAKINGTEERSKLFDDLNEEFGMDKAMELFAVSESTSFKDIFGENLNKTNKKLNDEQSNTEYRNRRRWNESRGSQTLEGAPIIKTRKNVTGADPELTYWAEEYARRNNISYQRQTEYVEVDEGRAKRIAEAYDKMKHTPSDPRVKEAFENLINQTIAQYRVLEEAGYKFYFFDETNDPYNGSPYGAMEELRNKKRMGSFATEAGFGSGATELNVEDNPMLVDTGIKWGYGSTKGTKKRVLANDLFRAVHDAFGHGLEGAGFRARGEENAWQSHARLFTGSAIGAITSETRGQNSWLNYGKFGEQNKTAKVEGTVFADQKTGLMPEWTWKEGFDAPKSENKEPSKQTVIKYVVEENKTEEKLTKEQLVDLQDFSNFDAQKLQDAFYDKSGLFIVSESKLVKSGLYNEYEASSIARDTQLQNKIKDSLERLKNTPQEELNIEEVEADRSVIGEFNSFGKLVALNPFLGESKGLNEDNLLYRSGDLTTKAEDAYTMKGTRGSGHFGTGFYFFGEKEVADNYDKRQTSFVDMSNYNMLRPKNGEKGIDLHEALKGVNNLRYQNNIEGIAYSVTNDFELGFYKYKDKLNFEELDKWLEKNIEIESYLTGRNYSVKPFKGDIELTNEILSDLKNEFESQVSKLEKELTTKTDKLFKALKDNGVNVDEQKKQIIKKQIQNYQIDEYSESSKGKDSIGTTILKNLGFEGINSKGIFELDNSLYGSVIFDIKQGTFKNEKQADTFIEVDSVIRQKNTTETEITLQQTAKQTENNKVSTLLNLSLETLQNNEGATREVLNEIEDDLIEDSIDVIGLKDQPIDENLIEYLTTLNSFIEEPSTDNTKLFAEKSDEYFKRDLTPKKETVVGEDGKEYVKLSTELSEEEVYNQQGLIKVADNTYLKTAKEDLATLYENVRTYKEKYPKDKTLEEYVQEQIANYSFKDAEVAEAVVLYKMYFGVGNRDSIDVIRDEDLNYFNINIKGVKVGDFNIDDKGRYYQIQNVFINQDDRGNNNGYNAYKKLISVSDKTIVSDDLRNPITETIWKKLTKEGLATYNEASNRYVSKDTKKTVSSTNQTSNFTGDYQYLTEEFPSDFYSKFLAEKKLNSKLFRNFYSNFEINEKGINIINTDPISMRNIRIYADENLRQYSILSKQMPNISDDLSNDESISERDNVVNNPQSLEKFQGKIHKLNNNEVIVKNNTEQFIKIGDNIYEAIEVLGNLTHFVKVENTKTQYYKVGTEKPTSNLKLADYSYLNESVSAEEFTTIKKGENPEELDC